MVYILKEWRKRHKEPGQPTTMTRDTAQTIVGLSADGYANQLSGRRALSRQTILLMMAWDLMTSHQREVFSVLSKTVKAESQRRVRSDYDTSNDDAATAQAYHMSRLTEDVGYVAETLQRLLSGPSDELTRQTTLKRIEDLRQIIKRDCDLMLMSGAANKLES